MGIDTVEQAKREYRREDGSLPTRWENDPTKQRKPPGLSQAQLDAQKAEDKAQYWLKVMGAG